MQPANAIHQIAYVLPDITEALNFWVEAGVGPFFVFENFALQDHKYRGETTFAQLTLAIAYSGHVQIELIAPQDDHPSVYREFLQRGQSGIHHFGYTAPNFDQEVERFRQAGSELALEGSLDQGTRIAYADTEKQLGHMLEFWEATEEILGLFEMIEDAARDWKGEDPVRKM